MKTHLLKIMLWIFAISFVAGACKKDEDEDTPPPEESDGQITFYTTSGECGDISLILNDEDIGPLSEVYSGSSEPDCGAANTITVGVDAGLHNYYATDTCNNIWSGRVIINMGDCKVIEFSR